MNETGTSTFADLDRMIEDHRARIEALEDELDGFISTREALNRFTTAPVSIEEGGHKTASGYQAGQIAPRHRELARDLMSSVRESGGMVRTHEARELLSQNGYEIEKKSVRIGIWAVLSRSGLFEGIETGRYRLLEKEAKKFQDDLDSGDLKFTALR